MTQPSQSSAPKAEETAPSLAQLRLAAARDAARPKGLDFVQALIDSPLYFAGDRHFADDASIVGGVGGFMDRPVTFIAIDKGRNVSESMTRHFGMVHPEGYRKALRLLQQAEKFGRPVLTFIDTPGAYPGVGAEERGQAWAISELMSAFAAATVPTIATITGEGASGGAMALALTDRRLMLENAIFAILSPEGFASILWKDASLASKAAERMGLCAEDIMAAGFLDEIIAEGPTDDRTFSSLRDALTRHLSELLALSPSERLQMRRQKLEVAPWD